MTSPTERQLADFRAQAPADQIETAVECLYALCQRALRARDDVRQFKQGQVVDHRLATVQDIYSLKTAFLEAAAVSGKATVRTFTWPTPTTWTCPCGRTWKGGSGRCYKCQAQAVGTGGQRDPWWVYLVGSQRFLQPCASEAIRSIAVPCVAMNPRATAAVGFIEPPFTIEAQMTIVELATATLRGG